jgi:mannose-1-phosphate guanylyltransferase/mannose-1-phosphate guanylyltransferase/mannose-6-phosphate isomerase
MRHANADGRRRIVPALLCGGSGRRLWPLSLDDQPKQFLPLLGELTPFQATAARVSDAALFAPPLVVANASHRDTVRGQMRSLGMEPGRIALEPSSRNTAPAAAVAALLAARDDPDALLLLLPADHAIRHEEAFLDAVAAGSASAESGKIVLFGVRPTHPSTAYGYIGTTEPLATGAAGCVARFTEKPSAAHAAEFVAAGTFLWNSGMALARASVLLAEIERHAPSVHRAAIAAVEAGDDDGECLRLDAASFGAAPDISLDYAVLEKTDRAVVVAADMLWADVGSWTEIWNLAPRDQAGNALVGSVLVENTSGSYLRSDGPIIVAIGLTDVIVVATGGRILIAAKSRDQDIAAVAARLGGSGSG